MKVKAMASENIPIGCVLWRKPSAVPGSLWAAPFCSLDRWCEGLWENDSTTAQICRLPPQMKSTPLLDYCVVVVVVVVVVVCVSVFARALCVCCVWRRNPQGHKKELVYTPSSSTGIRSGLICPARTQN